jgi:hypothetical protein
VAAPALLALMARTATTRRRRMAGREVAAGDAMVLW